jgi:hypothetical protein
MIDADLASLYQVETKYLKRQVKRNTERFPEDFMFELNDRELEILRCQSVTSSWGGTRYKPMAFTEQGIAMLSSVLGSPAAIQMNIQIIRIFTNMRELAARHEEMLAKMDEFEGRMDMQDEKIHALFESMRQLLYETVERSPIGFRQHT